MYLRKISVFFAVILLSIVSVSANEGSMSKDQDFIPRKVLFGNPDRISVRLSPDGKYISYVSPYEGVMNIHVAPIDDISSAKAVTFDKGKGVVSYNWLISSGKIVFSQDKDGDENGRLFLLDVNTKESKQITQDGVKSMYGGTSEKFSDEFLYLNNKRDSSYFDLFKYDLKTGKADLLYKNNDYASLNSDESLRLRFATKMLKNGDAKIDQFFYDESGKLSEVKEFMVVPASDALNTGIHSLNESGDKLLMYNSINKDKKSLLQIDLKTGDERILAYNDKADISDVLLHPKTREPQIVEHNYMRKELSIIDKAISDDIKNIKSFISGDFFVISRSLDNKFWIVVEELDNSPMKYYLYRTDNKEHKFLFTHNSRLEKYKLNKMHPVLIKARDDLEMASYLTLPSDIKWDDNKANKSAPMVLLVHGGPAARDVWGYHSVHQWLSDRGYAVLSVNYRGSLGFGKEFLSKGDGQWSKNMHEDLLDAVSWAIDSGVTEKDKVAIMGGSYGGYATLVGLTMTPDIFACGIDIVGMSNIETLYKSIPSYWKPAIAHLRKMMGLEVGTDKISKEEKEWLAEISPITYVDNISKPLLIAQGANDPRVKQAESDQIVAKMKEKKIPYTYLLYPNEGHGFARPENRMSFNAYAEEFLANCFSMDYEPIGDDLENSSVIVDKLSK